MNSFIQLLQKRRSIYNIEKKIPITKAELVERIEKTVKDAPTAFNSQSTKVVLLTKENHDKLWEIVKDTLRKEVPEDAFAKTEAKINSFKAGYGTILFFEDTTITKQFMKDNELYADNFPTWAQQANGISQFALWMALAEVNIGASLQHYNPLIDEEVKKVFDIPAAWQLVAQMPFGGIVKPADEKDYLPIKERVYIK